MGRMGKNGGWREVLELYLDDDDGEKGVWEPGLIQPILPILLVLSSFGENGENNPSMRRIRWMEVWCLAASPHLPPHPWGG